MKPGRSIVPRRDQKPEATDNPLAQPSVRQNPGGDTWTASWWWFRACWPSGEVTVAIKKESSRHG